MPPVTHTLYTPTREKWRSWLEKNHSRKQDVWLVYYKKHTRKPSIPYGEAVEEALCFGWIDTTVKTIDDEKYVQRFTPRKNISNWSELNKERARKMIRLKKMTPAGVKAMPPILVKSLASKTKKPPHEKFTIPKDLLIQLKADKETWEHFKSFPKTYQRIRIAWIDSARTRPKLFTQRLQYFLKMTKKGKRYGMLEK